MTSHASQGQTTANAQVEAAGNGPEQIYAGESRGHSQARMVEATAADVASIEAIRDGLAASGWTERVAEAEQWLAVARDDHAAAVAGVDYRDLAGHFGRQSAATPEQAEAHWHCGYPETAADKLGLAERETRGWEAGQ